MDKFWEKYRNVLRRKQNSSLTPLPQVHSTILVFCCTCMCMFKYFKDMTVLGNCGILLVNMRTSSKYKDMKKLGKANKNPLFS